MSQKLKCAWYFLGAIPQKRGVGLSPLAFLAWHRQPLKKSSNKGSIPRAGQIIQKQIHCSSNKIKLLVLNTLLFWY
jgi:hypothetical protein